MSTNVGWMLLVCIRISECSLGRGGGNADVQAERTTQQSDWGVVGTRLTQAVCYSAPRENGDRRPNMLARAF